MPSTKRGSKGNNATRVAKAARRQQELHSQTLGTLHNVLNGDFTEAHLLTPAAVHRAIEEAPRDGVHHLFIRQFFADLGEAGASDATASSSSAPPAADRTADGTSPTTGDTARSAANSSGSSSSSSSVPNGATADLRDH